MLSRLNLGNPGASGSWKFPANDGMHCTIRTVLTLFCSLRRTDLISLDPGLSGPSFFNLKLSLVPCASPQLDLVALLLFLRFSIYFSPSIFIYIYSHFFFLFFPAFLPSLFSRSVTRPRLETKFPRGVYFRRSMGSEFEMS